MATVLKNRNYLPGMNTAQTEIYNWEDVAQRAQTYLDTIRDQGAQLLTEAKTEAERIRNEARQNGLQAGQGEVDQLATNRANQLAKDQIAQAMASVEKLSSELENATQLWLRQWQHETIPLAIAIAEKIISRQMDADPEILMKWISDAIHTVQGARQLQIRMNPIDIEVLQPALGKLLEDLGRSTQIQLIPDDQISRHGLLVESPDGKIDMQMKTQLERLREELT